MGADKVSVSIRSALYEYGQVMIVGPVFCDRPYHDLSDLISFVQPHSGRNSLNDEDVVIGHSKTQNNLLAAF